MSPIDPDYVDVAQRLREFYERYPDGRITSAGEPWIMSIGGREFVAYKALAYRAADDPVPCAGTAWEPFPGPTNFTRDSELMNAETSAWGRAIVAAGIPSKKVASADEVLNRQGDAPSPSQRREQAAYGNPPTNDGPARKPSEKQLKYLRTLVTKSAAPAETVQVMLNRVGAQDIDATGKWTLAISGRQASELIDMFTNGALPEPSAPSDIPDDGFPSEPSPEDLKEAQEKFEQETGAK